MDTNDNSPIWWVLLVVGIFLGMALNNTAGGVVAFVCLLVLVSRLVSAAGEAAQIELKNRWRKKKGDFHHHG